MWKCYAHIDCGANTYGLGCRSICGNCSRGEACNHVNGGCPHGCDRGVEGRRCQAGINWCNDVMKIKYMEYNVDKF